MQFNPNDNTQLSALLQDPQIFAVNRRPAHSDHRYYPTLAAARNGGNMSWRLCLNGTWAFHYAENISARPIGFEVKNYDLSGFKQIQLHVRAIRGRMRQTRLHRLGNGVLLSCPRILHFPA